MEPRQITRKLQRLALKNKLFHTANGQKNFLTGYSVKGLHFESAETRRERVISDNMLRKAIRLLQGKRVMTRNELGPFTSHTSALFGILLLTFRDSIKLQRLKDGTFRMILQGTTFFFGGVCRGAKDSKLLHQLGGRFVFLSFTNLRTQKKKRWLERLHELDQYAIIDSGGFSDHNSGSTTDIFELLEFIKEHKNEKRILGFVQLDVIGDPEQTRKNRELMEAAGANILPVWQISDTYENLDALVAKGYELICIGGTYPLLKKRKFDTVRSIFNEVFKRHPEQPFHWLGGANQMMLEYPFFSCDSIAWLNARIFGKVELYLPNGETTKAPPHWTALDSIKQKVAFLLQLKESHRDMQVSLTL